MVVSHLQKGKKVSLEENLLADMLDINNLSINRVVTKSPNNQTGAIAKIIVRVKIAK
jgi:hypothetical protein